MIPLTTVQDLFDYNYWARDRQLERCAQVSQEQFVRPMANSFSSLRDTVAHLVGAEWICLERWRGKSPTMKDAQEFAAEKFPTLGAVQKRWQVEVGVRQYPGQPEVYVIGFPDGGRRYQGSTGGGESPHWKADGKEFSFWPPRTPT